MEFEQRVCDIDDPKYIQEMKRCCSSTCEGDRAVSTLLHCRVNCAVQQIGKEGTKNRSMQKSQSTIFCLIWNGTGPIGLVLIIQGGMGTTEPVPQCDALIRFSKVSESSLAHKHGRYLLGTSNLQQFRAGWLSPR